jgi:2-dehydropantoate 2-reductase
LKICILGAGSLGSAIGGKLAEAGNEVFLVNRNRAHVDAINRSGLILRTDGQDRAVKAIATADAASVGIVDLVVVLVKSLQTREAITAAKAMVGPDTTVVSLQNGLGHEEILAEVVGRDRVIAGKTYVGGLMIGPGHVIAGTAGKETIIGELDGGVSPRVAGIAETFGKAGLEVIISRNILGAMWDKLLVNVATGALSGITRLTYGDLYAVPEIEACAVAAVSEAMAVARTKGIVLTSRDPVEAWRKASAGLPPEFKASMLQSLEKGSVTEIDFINGAVVRGGIATGILTPVNLALVACIKGIERRLAAPVETTVPAIPAPAANPE